MQAGHPTWFAGELMEAEEAAAKYKELTGIGGFYPKDPALLSWRERGLLALQVFPVAPRAERTIEYTLVVPTRYEKGRDVLEVDPMGLQGRPAHMTLEAAQSGDRLWVNGQPYPNGALMPWPGSGDAEGQEGGGGDNGSAIRIELARSGVGKLSGRLASVPLTERGGLVHLRVEAARQLSSVPEKVSMVILIDRSYSMSNDDRAASLAAIEQVLRRLPSARVAVLGFHRTVAPLYPGFRPGYAARTALQEGELAAGNGSAVDEALATAHSLLSKEVGRERRIYLLSDLLTRSRLAVASLAPLVKGSLLHIGQVTQGEPSLDPEQEGAWAKLARATGELHWKGQARTHDVEASAMATVYEEWVRPTRLHKRALDGISGDALRRAGADQDVASDDTQVPQELHEGAAYEYFGLPFEHPRRIVAKGELWARPVAVHLDSTTAEERLWAALIFGDDLQQDLSPREMMTLAMRGRAVSPVTSYLAIEPGVRPSTEGLDDSQGLGGGGTGLGGSAITCYGTTGKGGSADLGKLLRELLARARASCKLVDAHVTARIETTYHEIVDVPEVKVDGADAGCIREAIWSWELPGAFSEERAEFAIDSNAAGS